MESPQLKCPICRKQLPPRRKVYCSRACVALSAAVKKFAKESHESFSFVAEKYEQKQTWCRLGRHWTERKSLSITDRSSHSCKVCYGKLYGKEPVREAYVRGKSWYPLFIKTVEQYGSLRKACRTVKVYFSTYLQRTKADAQFKKDTEAALERYLDLHPWRKGKFGFENLPLNRTLFELYQEHQSQIENLARGLARSLLPHAYAWLLLDVLQEARLMLLYNQIGKPRNLPAVVNRMVRRAYFRVAMPYYRRAWKFIPIDALEMEFYKGVAMKTLRRLA